MSTDLERLHAWMDRNGLDEKGLRQRMKRKATFAKVLSGARPITKSFRWFFGLYFGNAALAEVFGIDLGDDRENFEWGLRDRLWNPEQYAAQKAVALAVGRGELLPAKAHKCHGCDNQARDYHHTSYLPSDHLCVTPLCKSCHSKAHYSALNIPFGVVPTHTGLIRIAITHAAPVAAT